ncbi:1,4-dihydroxy-2-naphthoate prenyltransferase [Streptomyces tateyamensis]|uniref:1,4-dihydroxy-2-naphthoate prenyltransferase n=1 Tax=Streptomyces tateyamensis TaxID=565073 RepID=A0A2V4N8U4_9ACTN|nr:1,4-dihydroxy-2-naphthoate prenyltransferase [Streptomyces tateyamensis]
MVNTLTPSQAAGLGAARAPIPWRAYARLAKLDIYDYYLSVPLLAALAGPTGWAAPGRTSVVLLLVLLGQVTLTAALVTFDDVTGYRDGSDAANYGPDAPARRLARKPLVTGALTDGQAVRFGWLALAACAVSWAGALALAPHRPAWAVLGVVLWFALGFQYSWWLKLSYHGLQEVFIAALGWFFVLPFHGLLTGQAGGLAIVQTLLFGLGPLLFGVYSNINDIPGDRSVGRPTVAVLTSPRGNALFVAAVSALETVLIAGAAVSGLAPWWFLPAMAPVIGLRVRQFVLGIGRGDILRARLLGVRIHRLAVALLVAVDLLLDLGAAA